MNLIDHNVIYNCGGDGIDINGAVGQIVTQNVVSGNSVAGIILTNFCANCTVSYNVLDGNTYDGLYFDAAGATQSTFTHNTCGLQRP